MATETRLQPGEPAPGFTLPDAEGRPVSLSDFAGAPLVLYFYPAAGTPGCTKQACDFRDNLQELNSLGYRVVGISPDKPEKLRRFRDAEQLNFSLLSDPERKVIGKYGAWGEKKLYGRTTTGLIRSTFVIGGDGRVAVAQYNVKATGHVARLREQLASQPG